MKANTWRYIYNKIECQKDQIERKRGINRGGVSDGIACMEDSLALQWQRLNRIQNHVGLHYCTMRDREAGMNKAMCFYALFPDKKPV